MPKIGFHKDFIKPTAKQRTSALGPFPFKHKSNESRNGMLRRSADAKQQMSLLLKSQQNMKESNSTESDDPDKDDNDTQNCAALKNTAIADLDKEKLYKPTTRSETSKAIPRPVDNLDWLAQVPEEGQTFEDYVSYLTTRSTGRIRPIANAEGSEILLLPIVIAKERPLSHSKRSAVRNDGIHNENISGNDDVGGDNIQWPGYGPPLPPLLEYTKVFFDRNVTLLPAAKIYVNNDTGGENTSNRSKKKRKVENKKKKTDPKLGLFASSAKKGRFKLFFPQNDDGSSYLPPVNIAGRSDLTSDRIQIQVTSLLDELSRFRYSRHDNNEKDFCIMGITMIDLYDGPKDLFCAGMAFGGDKVAAFSFHRYHPFIKMHPGQWHNYGFGNNCDGYSYYEDDDLNPSQGLAHDPPSLLLDNNTNDENIVGSKKNDNDVKSEFLRRSSKLLSHELGHLFVLDHCIHNKCLMMGTGHLVEDFNAPSHLCGVCLRKLQWRTGFDVRLRYKLLSTVYDSMGMTKEREWTLKQFNYLS